MVIAIGDVFYKADAKEVLTHYFKKHEIPYVFIEEGPTHLNPKGVHPSWLKMICHRILTGYDAIICWDLDMLPTSPDTIVIDDFDMSKICLAYDSVAKRMIAGENRLPFCPDFKYNGGLICIPKVHRNFTEHIYDTFAPGTLPSWEQYYLNNMIVDVEMDIHELPSDINVLYSCEGFESARLKHYTLGDFAKYYIPSHKHRYFSDVSGYHMPKVYDNRIDMIFDLVPKGAAICEIGIFKGDLAKQLLKLEPTRLVLLDLFEGECGSGDQDGNNFEYINLNESYKKLREYFPAEVSIVKGDSSSSLSLEPDDSFDMIYIDGDHSYEGCKKDLMEAYKKVKHCGWIMGHDYEMNMNKAKKPYKFGVRKAVDEFCAEFSQKIFAKGNDGCVSYAIEISKA